MKNKIVKIIILLSILFIGPNNVKGISKEVIEAEDDNISIPYFIYESGSKVTVYDTTDYTLYAEWLPISTEKYSEIMGIDNECRSISDEVREYSNNMPQKEDYGENNSEYLEALNIYKDKISEYKNTYDACINKYYEAIPNFDDDKWEELIEDKVYLPNNSSSETIPYILYIKLDDRTNTLVDYEFAILKVDGLQIDEEEDSNSDVVSPPLDNNESINNEDNSISDSSVDSKIDNPKTGYYIPSLMLLVILLIFLIIIKIKNKKKFFDI